MYISYIYSTFHFFICNIIVLICLKISNESEKLRQKTLIYTHTFPLTFIIIINYFFLFDVSFNHFCIKKVLNDFF